MAYPMGEAKLEPLRVDFDRHVKLEFHGRGGRPDFLRRDFQVQKSRNLSLLFIPSAAENLGFRLAGVSVTLP